MAGFFDKESEIGANKVNEPLNWDFLRLSMSRLRSDCPGQQLGYLPSGLLGREAPYQTVVDGDYGGLGTRTQARV